MKCNEKALTIKRHNLENNLNCTSFILPKLIAVVEQYPEIPWHSIGHFRSTIRTRFSCK